MRVNALAMESTTGPGRRRRLAWLVAPVVASLAIGCGGGDTGTGPPPPPAPPPPPPVPVATTVSVSPQTVSPFIDDTVQFVAEVRDQTGAAMPDKQVTWTSSQQAIATIDATGRLVALTPGTVTVTAASEGRQGTAAVTVSGPGTTGGSVGSAIVNTGGGQVQATLPGGGSVALSVPSGAVPAPVEIVISPVAPAGRALAAFRVTPSGLRLDKPATLIVRVSPGVRVRSNTMLQIPAGDLTIPVPGTADPDNGTVTVSLTRLGIGAAGAASSAGLRAARGMAVAVADQFEDWTLVNLTINDRFNTAAVALEFLQQDETFLAADAMQFAMEGLLFVDHTLVMADPRFTPMVNAWTEVVCRNVQGAINALQSFAFVSDYLGLERTAAAVLGWMNAANLMGTFLGTIGLTGCPGGGPDAEGQITNKLTALQPAITADLNAFQLVPEPRDSLFLADRIGPLLDLMASLQGVGYNGAVQVILDIAVAQVDRMRLAGYQACRSRSSQGIQARLMRSETIGDAISALSTFNATDLENDIELCGMKVDWKLFDDDNAVVGSGTVGGGDGPGVVWPGGQASLAGNGVLELSGQLTALLCPASQSANNEQLEIAVGLNTASLTRVGLLTPANNNTYLSASPLRLNTESLRSTAGLPPDGTGTVWVVVRRIGGICNDAFMNIDHSPIGTVAVTFDSPCPGPAAREAAGTAARANVCLARFEAEYWGNISLGSAPCNRQFREVVATSVEEADQSTCGAGGWTRAGRYQLDASFQRGVMLTDVSKAGPPQTAHPDVTLSAELVDQVIIDAPGLVGTTGTLRGRIEVRALIEVDSGTCNSLVASGTVSIQGGVWEARRPSQVLFPDTRFTVRTCGGSDANPWQAATELVGGDIVFTYGTPFALRLRHEIRSAVTQFSPPRAGSMSATVEYAYRWLGMTGLPPNATVRSATGYDWSEAAPLPAPQR